MIITDHTLLETLRIHAEDPTLLEALDPNTVHRTWTRIHTAPAVDIDLWLISWPVGAQTDWHDHGTSSGAFTVLSGSLVEHTFYGGLQLVDVRPGGVRAFGAGYAHNVSNSGSVPALSLHAYSPRLTTMTRLRFRGDRLEPLGVETADADW